LTYRTIVADPPWRYPLGGGSVVGAEYRYPTLTPGKIAALPVNDLADEDGAHLWLWATNGMLEHAYPVARAWGFTPVQLVTWCKPSLGVGRYVRSNTEHAILAIRGRRIPPARAAAASWYQWPRRDHSRKPDAFYDLVEQVSPGPYLELFARDGRRLGWDTWGNEALCHVELGQAS
jgi:N6-adenosine-specific RNA methylase IME4